MKLGVKVGYGFDDERIGPEYAFGLYMDKAMDEPILIIKTAWGGKSLAVDFRKTQFAAVELYDQRVDPPYRGNVIGVDSGHFYELELSDIYWKRRLKLELTAQEQSTWDRCASNAEYHYLGSGKTYIRFGQALAEAMLELEKN